MFLRGVIMYNFTTHIHVFSFFLIFSMVSLQSRMKATCYSKGQDLVDGRCLQVFAIQDINFYNDAS